MYINLFSSSYLKALLNPINTAPFRYEKINKWWMVVGGGGWWWVMVGGGGWWWMVVGGGGWWWVVVDGW